MIKVPGKKLKLSGKEYVFAPLPLIAFELYDDEITNFSQLSISKQAKLVIDVAFISLKRNYDEITREEVGHMLDMKNLGIVFETVMSTSDLEETTGESEAGK